jgi:hypothetical protein
MAKSKDADKAPAKSEGKKGGAGKDGAEKPPGRLKQIGMIAKLLHKKSPKSIPIAVAIFVVVLGLAILGGFLTGSVWYWVILGIPTAFLAGFIYFTRSAQKMQYRMLEGQLGGGMAILENMRGNWIVTPGVNGTREMDVVHRVVGRPGVVLVGEGNPNRLKPLLAKEKKRVSRVAYNTPIYDDIIVGQGEGLVPVSKLQRTILKLPRNLNKAEVAQLNYRLKALPPAMQMPKGPIPKGVKMPKGPKMSGGPQG